MKFKYLRNPSKNNTNRFNNIRYDKFFEDSYSLATDREYEEKNDEMVTKFEERFIRALFGESTKLSLNKELTQKDTYNSDNKRYIEINSSVKHRISEAHNNFFIRYEHKIS